MAQKHFESTVTGSARYTTTDTHGYCAQTYVHGGTKVDICSSQCLWIRQHKVGVDLSTKRCTQGTAFVPQGMVDIGGHWNTYHTMLTTPVVVGVAIDVLAWTR